MNKFVALAALTMALAMPAAYADIIFDVAVGYNASHEQGNFDGPKDTARFTLTWAPKPDGFFMSYTHVSHFSVGWPVNEKPEDFIDMIEVGYRFNMNKFF